MKTYINAYKYKDLILKENKNKSGIYRWNNIVTGKSYIGSSLNLSKRFNEYYYLKYYHKRLSRSSSIIYNSVIKYGHINFSLDILEYCNLSVLIEREQYYIDLLNPEYNILKKAGSRLGVKLSEETKNKMRLSATGRKHTFETKEKMRISSMGHTLSEEVRKKVSIATTLRVGVGIKVFDRSDNLVKEFSTISSAAKHFKISASTLSRYKDTNKSYNGYTFKSNKLHGFESHILCYI
jgi:group I intron endonuclease